TYYMYDDGAYNGFAPMNDRPIKLKRELGIQPLSEFLRSPVDFLNIDCEGMDYEILKTHDWAHKPAVIATEGKEGEEAGRFLASKGYALHSKAGMTLIYKLI